jgi:hypothetical protein
MAKGVSLKLYRKGVLSFFVSVIVPAVAPSGSRIFFSTYLPF